MSGADKDPMVNRAIDELRRLPELDRNAVDRVVRAAAAARVAPADPDPADLPRTRSIRVWHAVGLTAAAAIVGFAVGELRPSKAPAQPASAAVATAPQGDTFQQVNASAAALENAPIAQEFVLEATQATRVALVGDFNNWNPKANLMTRDAAGKWSTIVTVVPGRHIYGFMVNDSIFTLDPRAMKARDPDLGGDGSVRIVGRP